VACRSRRRFLPGRFRLADDYLVCCLSTVGQPIDFLSLGSFTVCDSEGSLQPVKESYRWSQVLPGGKHILHITFDPTIGRHRARVARFREPGSTRNLLKTDSRTLYTPSLAKPESGIPCPCVPGTSRIPCISVRYASLAALRGWLRRKSTHFLILEPLISQFPKPKRLLP
jgi:hypothetical protein